MVKKIFFPLFTCCFWIVFSASTLWAEEKNYNVLPLNEIHQLFNGSREPDGLGWMDLCYRAVPSDTHPVIRERIIDSALDRFSENTNTLPKPSDPRLSTALRDQSTNRPPVDSSASLGLQDYLENRQDQDKKESWFEIERQKIIKKTLDETTFKINVGYMFVRGEQSFEIIHPDTRADLSKLTYPIRGGLSFVSAESKIIPRFSIGGRYATSNFNKETSKDEDWNIPAEINGVPTTIDYQITEQDTKNKASFWNVNLYGQIYDWSNGIEEALSKNLLVDKLSLEAFVGYQHYKGRHTAIDPITKYELLIDGQWYYVPTPLYDGLNSWYEVTYKGPRVGFRFSGSRSERFSSSASFSYAWLTTKANAYWNLRDYAWSQKGRGYGSALNVDIEAEYRLTSHWFLGGGLHYMWQKHKKALESGTQPGYSYDDFDIARNIQVRLFGLSLQAGYRW